MKIKVVDFNRFYKLLCLICDCIISKMVFLIDVYCLHVPFTQEQSQKNMLKIATFLFHMGKYCPLKFMLHYIMVGINKFC